jgi:hypothetical protein
MNGNAGARVMITVFPATFTSRIFAQVQLERNKMLLNKMTHIVTMAPEKTVLHTSADKNGRPSRANRIALCEAGQRKKANKNEETEFHWVRQI